MSNWHNVTPNKENFEMKKGPQQINAETFADAFLVEK